MLSRNVGKELRLYAAEYPKTAQISALLFCKFLRFSRLSFWLRLVLGWKWVRRNSGVIQKYTYREKHLPGPIFGPQNSHGMARNWNETFLYINLRTLENSVIAPILKNEKRGCLTLRFHFVESYQITRNKGSFALCRIKYENTWQLPSLCLNSHTSVYCT
jgi:hypothetical protein